MSELKAFSYSGKRVLVVGMAKSGIAVAEVLKQLGSEVVITDLKTQEDLGDLVDSAAPYVDDFILGAMPTDLTPYAFIVMSPGVPLEIPLVKSARAQGIEVIGEIELAYRLTKGTFVGITGTNGKTTTTTLTGEMFKAAEKAHDVVGNIGIPAISKALGAGEENVLVTELSSFQLESIDLFRAHIAAIINITPDHLNRHKTMANYIAAKARIFENQTAEDYAILNAEDPLVSELAEGLKAKIVYFSRERVLEQGVYIEDGAFFIHWQDKKIKVANVSDLFVPGRHNVQNALVAIAIAYFSGIEIEVIASVLKAFKGVDHRVAYVTEIKGRVFYNDSKGTNPESTICALEAMERPTILIAGGMDKKSEFDTLATYFKGRLKALVVLGETQENIINAAEKADFHDYYRVSTMDEAVEKAYELSDEGDIILLSPACASWDMYPNFETRGEHFKSCVKSLEIRWL